MPSLAWWAAAYQRPPPRWPPPEPGGLATLIFTVGPAPHPCTSCSPPPPSAKPKPRERRVSRCITTVDDSTARPARSPHADALDMEDADCSLRLAPPMLMTLSGTRRRVPESGKERTHDEPPTAPRLAIMAQAQARPGCSAARPWRSGFSWRGTNPVNRATATVLGIRW